jgi:glutamate dehydrogenase/leucine dehydrogenase
LFCSDTKSSEVETKLQDGMEKAINNVYNVHETRGVNMRLAAYMTSVQELAEAYHLRIGSDTKEVYPCGYRY